MKADAGSTRNPHLDHLPGDARKRLLALVLSLDPALTATNEPVEALVGAAINAQGIFPAAAALVVVAEEVERALGQVWDIIEALEPLAKVVLAEPLEDAEPLPFRPASLRSSIRATALLATAD